MAMSRKTVEALKRRACHFLDPTTAAAANISIAELQQFIAGTYHPTGAQLIALARRMSIPCCDEAA